LDEEEPAAVRPWTRLNFKTAAIRRDRTEKRLTEAKREIDVALNHFNVARDLIAGEFSNLRVETPKFTGRYDAFFVTFINELAYFVVQVTGRSPDPNGQAFERFVVAAHKTLTIASAERHLPSIGEQKWSRAQAVKRHGSVKDAPRKGSKTKHSSWNSKIRNALDRRAAEMSILQSVIR
jgi:hypothetical protein